MRFKRMNSTRRDVKQPSSCKIMVIRAFALDSDLIRIDASRQSTFPRGEGCAAAQTPKSLPLWGRCRGKAVTDEVDEDKPLPDGSDTNSAMSALDGRTSVEYNIVEYF